jgi:hypothetical protein
MVAGPGNIESIKENGKEKSGEDSGKQDPGERLGPGEDERFYKDG